MKKTKLTRSLLAACSIVVLSAVAYGCSSGVSQSEADRQAAEAAAAAAAAAQAEAEAAAAAAAAKAEADRLAAIEAARTAINMAATAAEAQAAKDAVDDIATATEAAGLQAAVDARVAALAMMDREAAQKMALMDAAGMIDTSDLSTQAAVDAARAAIVMLRGALANAADVSEADKAMYMTLLNDAVSAVDTAQGGIDTETRRTMQMEALSGASDDLQAALTALAGQAPTQAQINAASAALAALNSAIEDAADLTADETATYQREADNAAAPISTAQSSLDDAEKEAQDMANAAMAATARKLYAGISAQSGAGDGTTFAATDRDAFYNATATAIMVSIGDGTNTPTEASATLLEDRDAMIADLHGWQGKKYARTLPADEGMYEAVVYSNVEDPTMGRKFGHTSPGTGDNRAYEYLLNTDGILTAAEADGVGDTTTNAFIPSRVVLTGVTRTAGTETFLLPEGRPEGETIINVPGSYHGVSGAYSCDTGDGTSTCLASIAAGGGLTLAGTGTWTFEPSNSTARVMDAADTDYASYGWWLHKNEADSVYTASAFVDEKGTVDAATGLTALNGTATYMGGAAGKYALSSPTDGTNDAGHFTARATLKANFSINTTEAAISGTIDQFMGADGMPRDWTVKLNGSQIGDTGEIGNASASADVQTVWTIGETAGNAGGSWSGTLRNNGDDLVPQVATGTFYSVYGRANDDGRMVGAFGANKQPQ